jgi:hypothetical protein
MKKYVLPAIASAIFSLPAVAGLNSLGSISQPQFESLAHDIGSALSYKAVSPGSPQGWAGFEVGVVTSATRLQHSDILLRATGEDISTLVLPKIYVQKGLPFDIDVGGYYTRLPSLDMSLYGTELRWSPYTGGPATPAVSLRASYTRLAGVSQLDFRSSGIDVTVSKGILMFKPYVGAGLVHSKSTPHAGSLQAVSLRQTRYFGGIGMGFGLFTMGLEADRTGEAYSYSLRLGAGF